MVGCGIMYAQTMHYLHANNATDFSAYLTAHALHTWCTAGNWLEQLKFGVCDGQSTIFTTGAGAI